MRHAWSGGAERYLNYLAKGLAERGHEVTIACRSHGEPPHPDVQFELLRPFAIGSAWRYWAFARSLEKYFAANSARFDAVFGLGRTWSQDIIRVSGGCHQTWLDTMSDGKEGGRRTRLKDRIYLRLEARSFAPGAYKKIICNSAMVRRDVIQRYQVPEEAIEVIHNGADLERFNPRHRTQSGLQVREQAGFSQDNVVFVFLGTGFQRKGLDLLLQAFSGMSQAQPQARVLVAGRDSRMAAYQRQARALGVSDKVVFLGERLDAEACLAAGDVLVLPTRYDPFANVTVEALASGLPVITSDTNGGAEMIPGDSVGSVVPMGPGVVTALTNAMKVWCDPLRIAAGRAAAREVAEQHGIESKLEDAVRLIQDVAHET